MLCTLAANASDRASDILRLSVEGGASGSAASRKRSVASCHVNLLKSSVGIGLGSVWSTSRTHSANSSRVEYVRQFEKVEKNSFDGCRAHTTNFPMARASAVVVATTSEREGLMKNLYPCVISPAWSARPWKVRASLSRAALACTA